MTTSETHRRSRVWSRTPALLRSPCTAGPRRRVTPGRPMRVVGPAARGQFLLEYIDLLLDERVREPAGFRHRVVTPPDVEPTRHDRWVINKLRALVSWYSKGIENGSHLRTAINAAESLNALRDVLSQFFLAQPAESHACALT